MQECPVAVRVTKAGGREPWMFVEQRVELRDVAVLYDVGCVDHYGIVSSDETEVIGVGHDPSAYLHLVGP